MIGRLSEYIVSWQIKRKILTEEQRVIYLYAYEVFMNYALNMIIAFLIAIIMKAVLPVLLYLIIYFPMRFYGGGYHAKTNGGCTVASAFLIIIVCLIEKTITGNIVFVMLPVSFAISGGLIFCYAPVSAINKPLDELETVRYRLRSRQVWLVEAVIGMLSLFISTSAGVVIAMSHILFSFALIGGMLVKRKNKA